MTREDIEKIKTIEPSAIETDREQQWYEVGLVHGLRIADKQPHVLWHSPEEKPEQDSWFLGQIGDEVFDTFGCPSMTKTGQSGLMECPLQDGFTLKT